MGRMGLRTNDRPDTALRLGWMAVILVASALVVITGLTVGILAAILFG